MKELKTVGKSVVKVDAQDKVTGKAVYAADVQLPGMLYGKIVRCWEHAHAKVVSLDFTEALKVPGVVKVLGPKDVTGDFYNTGVLDLMVSEEQGKILGDIADQKIFTDHVKYHGDAIAGVIAESEEAAELAAEKVKAVYEALPVYLSAADSKKPGALQFEPRKPGNLAFQLPQEMFPNNAYGWGDVDAEMKKADLVIEETFTIPKVKQAQMEPHSYVAQFEPGPNGRLSCWTSTQMPKLVHAKLAKLFKLPMSRVNLVSTTIGGGFGGRLGMVFEPETCAMAVAVPGRPVKVQSSREEDWFSESRHPGQYRVKMGFKKDGTPVACDAHFTSDKGAYFTHGSGVAFTTGSWLTGMYQYGAVRYRGDTYYTNQAPSGAFRGYGNPQTNFALEQIVDRGCEKLGIDPVEWRKRWHKGVGQDGWCMGVTYASCALDECLDRGAKAIGWKEKRALYANQTGPKRRGIGVSVMNHTSGAMPMLLEHTTCTVKMNEDASAVISLACSDIGQGSHTVLKQMAAEVLDMPMDEIHLHVNMDAAGFDIGSHASRTTYVGGGAVVKACEDVRRQWFDRASARLGVPVEDLELKDRTVVSKRDPSKAMSVKEICHTGVYNFVNPQNGQHNGVPGQIQGYASYFPSHNSPPFGACFAEVEVDIETGEVEVLELVVAHDIGRAINPKAVEAQIEGGAQQALGMALTEEVVYDARGIHRNNSFTDYKMFGPMDMPKMKVILVEQPDPNAPFGAKSVGEAGPVNPLGATANAVSHALGIMFTQAPMTPERVLKAIVDKGVR